jgi:hypothetical protein
VADGLTGVVVGAAATVGGGDVAAGDVAAGDVAEGGVAEGGVAEGDVAEGGVAAGDVAEGDVSRGADEGLSRLVGGGVECAEPAAGAVRCGVAVAGDAVGMGGGVPLSMPVCPRLLTNQKKAAIINATVRAAAALKLE